MTTTSILVQSVVDKYLHTAKQNLEQDGYLQPVLFLHIAGNDMLIMPLRMPDQGGDKRAQYLFDIGRHLSQRELRPSEAILLSESWVVAVREAPAAMKMRPSEHPSRQEAIVAIGRNAEGSRFTQVVQPFSRDKNNRPVWLPQPIAVYDEKQTAGKSSAGLLDSLFEAVSAYRH